MKTSWMKWPVFIFGLSLLLPSCGGGGGGALIVPGGGSLCSSNSVTVNITTAPASSKTYCGNESTDPSLFAEVAGGFTWTLVRNGFNSDRTAWTKELDLLTNGITEKSYDLTAVEGDVEYMDNGNSYMSTSGTITITSIGAAGTHIVGTFDATLCLLDGFGACTATTIDMNGSFNVTRMH